MQKIVIYYLQKTKAKKWMPLEEYEPLKIKALAPRSGVDWFATEMLLPIVNRTFNGLQFWYRVIRVAIPRKDVPIMCLL